MLAVIQIAGHQHIVSQGDKFRIDQAVLEDTVVCDKVLLVTEPDGKGLQVGTPYVEGMIVECKVIDAGRGDKVRVYKMKPKKRYSRTYGHRQDYTELEVVKIGKGKTAPARKAVKEDAPAEKETAAKEAPNEALKAEKPAADKKPAVKKASTKKPEAKRE